MTEQWDPSAPQTGMEAPDLRLVDQANKQVRLSQLARQGPILLLFFAGPEDERGRALLRDYRDRTLSLQLAGVRIAAVGRGEPSALSFLRMEMGLGFPLLADLDGTEAARFGMDGRVGLFLLDRALRVRQRALEGRAPAVAMLQFLKRGGIREQKVSLPERIVHFVKSLQAALKPRRPQPH